MRVYHFETRTIKVFLSLWDKHAIMPLMRTAVCFDGRISHRDHIRTFHLERSPSPSRLPILCMSQYKLPPPPHTHTHTLGQGGGMVGNSREFEGNICPMDWGIREFLFMCMPQGRALGWGFALGLQCFCSAVIPNRCVVAILEITQKSLRKRSCR